MSQSVPKLQAGFRFAGLTMRCGLVGVLSVSLWACDKPLSKSEESRNDGAVVENAQETLTKKKDTALEKFTSNFTKFSLDACRVVKADEESGGKDYICPGYKGAPLHVRFHDSRYLVVAGPDNQLRQPSLGFNTLGGTIEWRNRANQLEPFALIYRYLVDHGSGQGDSILAVAKVGRENQPGCVMAIVAASSQQNLKAREFADARGESYDCTKDEIHQLSGADKPKAS